MFTCARRLSSHPRRLAIFLVCMMLTAVVAFAHPAPAAASTVVNATTYTANQTWTEAGSPYLVRGNVTVSPGVTLTIEPGVIVKFSGASRELNVKGHLRALGAAGDRIIFTAIQDDVGGDHGIGTAEGQGATQGAKGQWMRIFVSEPTATAELEYADIRYGGSGCCSPSRVYGALWSHGGDVRVHETTIRNNQNSAIYIAKPGTTTRWPKATVTNSLLMDNAIGISALDASTEILASLIQQNTSEGLYLMTGSGYTGPASTVYDSDIAYNGKPGVFISMPGSVPANSWPKGSRNNIYLNDQLSTTPYQLVPGSIPDSVDWTGNFWGDDVRYATNPGGCPTAGRLEHANSTTTPKKGPFPHISTRSYVAGQGWLDCVLVKPTLGPNDFEADYIKHPLPAAWYETLESMIAQRAPVFLYDSGEQFEILAADAMTSVGASESISFSGTNTLREADDDFFASTSPTVAQSNGWDVLNLDYLGSFYDAGPSPRAGSAALPTDYIDARGSDQATADADSASMGSLHNKVYARVAYGSDGWPWLQYWVFWYYNPSPFCCAEIGGAHEGDWEMVQVKFLPANLEPITASYAQHGTGATCSWDYDVEKAGLAPVVYVAESSHASYLGPDRIPLAYDYDHADGLGGGTFSGNLELLHVTNPGWLYWPGSWGGDGGGPSGPGHGGNESKWDDPSAWAAQWGCP